MKLIQKIFSNGEIKENKIISDDIKPIENNKNLELINDSEFDLNGILEDFDAKINFLYEKISKMETKLQKKDEEIKKLREILHIELESPNQETSIANQDSEIGKYKDIEPVDLVFYYYFKYNSVSYILFDNSI